MKTFHSCHQDNIALAMITKGVIFIYATVSKGSLISSVYSQALEWIFRSISFDNTRLSLDSSPRDGRLTIIRNITIETDGYFVIT